MKKISLIAAVIIGLIALPIPAALADCEGNLQACEQLIIEASDDLDEMHSLNSDLLNENKRLQDLLMECEARDCDDCGWVTLVKDKTFMTAVIGGAVLLIGGVAGLFIPVPGQ